MFNKILLWIANRYIFKIDIKSVQNKFIIVRVPAKIYEDYVSKHNILCPQGALGVAIIPDNINIKMLDDTELMTIGLKRIDFHMKKEI